MRGERTEIVRCPEFFGDEQFVLGRRLKPQGVLRPVGSPREKKREGRARYWARPFIIECIDGLSHKAGNKNFPANKPTSWIAKKLAGHSEKLKPLDDSPVMHTYSKKKKGLLIKQSGGIIGSRKWFFVGLFRYIVGIPVSGEGI